MLYDEIVIRPSRGNEVIYQTVQLSKFVIKQQLSIEKHLSLVVAFIELEPYPHGAKCA